MISPRSTACTPPYRPYSSEPKTPTITNAVSSAARAGAPDRGGEGLLVGLREARRLGRLLRKLCTTGIGVQHFACDALVSAMRSWLARESRRTRRPISIAGSDDQRDDPDDGQHHSRVGRDQHRDAADEQHGVAQAHRDAGADRGLDDRRCRWSAATALRRSSAISKNCRALRQHVGVDGAAQVGRHALADPGHHEEARGGEDAERGRHDEERAEVAADRDQLLADSAAVGKRQPVVDEQLALRKAAPACWRRRAARNSIASAIWRLYGATKGSRPRSGLRRRGAGVSAKRVHHSGEVSTPHVASTISAPQAT